VRVGHKQCVHSRPLKVKGLQRGFLVLTRGGGHGSKVMQCFGEVGCSRREPNPQLGFYHERLAIWVGRVAKVFKESVFWCTDGG